LIQSQRQHSSLGTTHCQARPGGSSAAGRAEFGQPTLPLARRSTDNTSRMEASSSLDAAGEPAIGPRSGLQFRLPAACVAVEIGLEAQAHTQPRARSAMVAATSAALTKQKAQLFTVRSGMRRGRQLLQIASGGLGDRVCPPAAAGRRRSSACAWPRLAGIARVNQTDPGEWPSFPAS